jgi:hypothetical protein
MAADGAYVGFDNTDGDLHKHYLLMAVLFHGLAGN